MPLAKFALELGPLVIFFLTNSWLGIYWATGFFMAAFAISLVGSKLILKQVPIMQWVMGLFVLVFGGLTIALQDDTFIKIKVTIIYVFFAIALTGGLFFGHSLMKMLLSEAIKMQEEGWRILTVRWIVFFLFLAGLNEVVWRNFPEWWVSFKAFGILPITFLFMMSQVGLLQKYQTHE